MEFLKQLEETIKDHNSLLCIGLDTDISKIPPFLQIEPDAIYQFNKAIVDATSELVCCYKANIAFYTAYGSHGLEALQQTVAYIKDTYEHIPVIVDAKRADIGSTSEKYAKEAFDIIDADAVTVNPYMGFDSIKPFLERKDRGVIILCRTSNPGAADFQELLIEDKPLYLRVAEKVAEWNTQYGNCLMVVGATAPEQMKEIRKIAPNMFFLVPGIGTQGGNLEAILQAGLTNEKSGLLIHSARDIIYASVEKDFAQTAKEKATKLRDEINTYRL